MWRHGGCFFAFRASWGRFGASWCIVVQTVTVRKEEERMDVREFQQIVRDYFRMCDETGKLPTMTGILRYAEELLGKPTE